MLKTVMAVAATGVLLLLLLGTSDVMARVLSGWLAVELESASGTVPVPAAGTPCMVAAQDLRTQGFNFVTATHLEPRLAALIFTSSEDSATLFCVANIVEEQSGLIQ